MATKLHNQMTGADPHPNAIDGTTGTELTPSSLTVLDSRWIKQAGGATITVPAAGNVIGLTVAQNDTTNNPRAISVTNTGTSTAVNITQSGNGQAFVITDTSNQISYTVNKNSTGTAFYITRNQSNGLSAMAIFNQSNASDPQDLFQMNNAGTGKCFIATDTGSGTSFVINKNGTGTAFSITRNQTNGSAALARINQSNASDPQDAFQIANAGTGSALLINTNDVSVKGGNTGIGIVTSKLHVAGPLATAITTTAKTSAYTASAADSTILADASGGTFQITLPTAVGCTGRQYTIKRTGATNNVTLGGTSAQTFDGATTKTLGSQFATITVQSDNANWQIIGQLGTVS